jgi:hypothetical protein
MMNASELETLFEEADKIIAALMVIGASEAYDDDDGRWDTTPPAVSVIERLKSAVTDTLALVDECKASGSYDAREHKRDKKKIKELEKKVKELWEDASAARTRYNALDDKYFKMCQYVSGKKPRYIEMPAYYAPILTTLDDVSMDCDSDAGYSRIIDDAERTAGIK